MINKQITGNIGEWSELYTLAFILANNGLYGADKNQNKIDTLFYKTLSIVIDDKNYYQINKDDIEVFSGSESIKSIKKIEIKKNVNNILNELLVDNQGRAFPLMPGSNFLNLINKTSISSSKTKKNDIDLIIRDSSRKIETPLQGFTIKSQLGSPSTLVNASGSTNFKYEIIKNNEDYEDISNMFFKTVKEKVQYLIKNNYTLSFAGVDSNIFSNNLSLIDSKLEKYLSDMLVSYYSKKGIKFSDLANLIFSEKKDPILKLKEFLGIMALGMMPNSEWNKKLTALGGLILVKNDGEVLCYYLHNIDEFREYLFNNVKLETPSTSRHKFGTIYKENNKLYIKLNLQIRFLK